MSSKYYVFFDVDGTIIQGKSMFSFIRFFWKQQFSLCSYIGLLRYQLYLMKVKKMKKNNVSRDQINEGYYKNFKGVCTKKLGKAGYKWWEKELASNKQLFNQEIITHLEKHKKQGAEIIFVSGSMNACLEPLKNQLNVDHLIATNLEIKNKKYTGNIINGTTIGLGKASKILAFIQNKNIALDDCYAYGDHHSDIPMLNLVGHPVVVGKNTQLLAHAKQHNWQAITLEQNKNEIK